MLKARGAADTRSLEGVQRWLGSVPQGIESGERASLAIVSAGDGRLLGSVGIDRSCDDPAIGEVGYWVSAEARRQNVATRAVRLLVDWAWDALSLERIEICPPSHPVGTCFAYHRA